MDDFPAFMRHPDDRVPATQQNTAGVEGYVFEGASGVQVALWTCPDAEESAWHVHEFDEYIVVLAGEYVLLREGAEVVLHPGDEAVIAGGVLQGARVAAGTRTMHAFGGPRISR